MGWRRQVLALGVCVCVCVCVCVGLGCRDVPEGTPPAQPVGESPKMIQLAPEQVDRTIPPTDGDRWEAAYAAYLAEVRFPEAWVKRDGFRCRLAPLVGADGEIVPCIFEMREGNTRAVLVARDGRLIPTGAGRQEAEAFLASVGFPAERPMSWQLFGELMRYLGLMDAPAGTQGTFFPLVRRWEDLGAHYEAHTQPLPSLHLDGDQAEFVAHAELAVTADGGGDVEPIIARRTIRLRAGKLTVEDARLEDGTWRPWTR